ncbi:hypothetical protein RV15_GL003249 [Enterococcus silesiacus]|uniref:Uncharacterized protein n=1 Tax=Enterococcus silesiacus TaxID=332949 RepID=A0AA91GFS4_9ENTE|nr:hypothetical protein RV15_GL003249 [Enterococcus silesiacus]
MFSYFSVRTERACSAFLIENDFHSYLLVYAKILGKAIPF